MARNPEKKFVNFPVFLLTETIRDPERGLQMILAYHCQATWNRLEGRYSSDEALSAFAYEVVRGQESVPKNMKDIADKVSSALYYSDYEGFHMGRFEPLEELNVDLDFNELEQSRVLAWYILHLAGQMVGTTAAGAYRLCELGEEITAPEKAAFASVPLDYFIEIYNGSKSQDEMRQFRTVAAVRSIIGKSQWKKTNKAHIAARMIGAKSTKEVQRLVESNPVLKAEHAQITARRRMDKLLDEGEVRGFYHKNGYHQRGITLSIKLNDRELAEHVVRKNRRYKDKKDLVRIAAKQAMEAHMKEQKALHHAYC